MPVGPELQVRKLLDLVTEGWFNSQLILPEASAITLKQVKLKLTALQPGVKEVQHTMKGGCWSTLSCELQQIQDAG